MEPIINKTGRAVIATSILAFCAGIIVWLVFYGVPANSLHQSALSWSYTVMLVMAGALGLDAAVARLLPSLTVPK